MIARELADLLADDEAAQTIAYLAERDRRRAAVLHLQAQYSTPQSAIRAATRDLRSRATRLSVAQQLESVADWLEQSGYHPVEIRRGGASVREMW